MNTASNELIERVTAALAAGELVLHFQPKVNMRNGRVVGTEALLRWRHPELGMLPPADFLPQIEQNDLVVAIGRWVVDAALSQLDQWRRQGIRLTVGVNISARQLLAPTFLDDLRASLDRYPDISPETLELEILEAVALENMHQARGVIEACRDWGVRFALDNFGTGYVSLACLFEIPAEVLKIDRGFIADLLDDSDNQTLVESVIILAKLFRRVVMAQGVESAEQGLMLMRMGCDVAQGFFIARPMPASELPGWLADFRPDPQWLLWADIPWEMGDLPLLVAKYDHTIWVQRVLDYLDGDDLQLSMGELSDHHTCRFGRWYDQQGHDRYRQLPAFQEIEAIHRQVHQLGTEIVRLRDSGDLVWARELAEELRHARDSTLAHLDELQSSVVLEPVGQRMLHAHHISPDRAKQIRPHAASANSAYPAFKNGKPSVLIVDISPESSELLAGALASDYKIKFASGGEQALELASGEDRPDLVLLEVMLHDMDGFEVCRRLKENPATHGIPVIFITAKNEASDQTRAFNSGAIDYIAKPFVPSVVKARVHTHVSLMQRTNLLEAQAFLDALTGVPNRRRFDETFRHEWQRAARNLMPLSLLIIDVDHFKAFNDHYGHGAGDDCLQKIGQVLTHVDMRPGDFVARYGGEEFAVILPGCHAAGALTIAERIRAQVEALAVPHTHSSVAPYVTISVGVATVKPTQGGDPVELFQRADKALYRAKQQGRNQFQMAD
jgi:diguanylate cyclase (GGDEF)-like protein